MNLSAEQQDQLRELSNIGMGHAATALSQLLGQGVMLRVPRVRMVDLAEVPLLLGGDEQLVAGVSLQMLGAAHGSMLLVFPAISAGQLVTRLTGSELNDPIESEVGVSTLCEVGNIVASCYLGVLGEMLGQRLLPSVPVIAYDMAAAVVDEVLGEVATENDQALVVETEFYSSGEEAPLRGHFFLLPNQSALELILQQSGGAA